MSADVGGFIKFFGTVVALGMLFVASLITAGVTGVAYFQNHDESSMGWFITSVVILSLYVIASIILCIVACICDAKESKKPLITHGGTPV